MRTFWDTDSESFLKSGVKQENIYSRSGLLKPFTQTFRQKVKNSECTVCIRYLHGEVGGETADFDVSWSRPISGVHFHLFDVTGSDPSSSIVIVLLVIFVIRLVLFVLVVRLARRRPLLRPLLCLW